MARLKAKSEFIKAEGETKKISQQNATDIYVKGESKTQIWHLKIMPPL